ncbi:MAG: exodeoxyribonuclease-3 [Clostridium sp.]|jgi:exodeoxyribonuclease-3
MDFYDALLDYCEILRSKGKKLIICGDYNTAQNAIDLKNPKANEKHSGFLSIERACWINLHPLGMWTPLDIFMFKR